MGRNQRIALAVAAAVILLGGVVAVFVAGGDDDSQVETTGSETDATVGVDDVATEPDTGAGDDGEATDPGGTDDSGDDAATEPSGSTGGDKAVSSGSGDAKKSGSAEAMAATTPPKAGAYKYKVVRNGQNEETTTRVEDRGREGDAVRQRIIIESSEGSIDNEVSWRPDGLYVLESTIVGGKCDWQPDSLQLKLPLSVGVTWTSESTCTADTNFGTFDIKRKLTGKVTGTQTVAVAGENVDVWVIEEQEHIEFSGQGQGPGGTPQAISGTDDTTGTVLFSPKHGVSVKYDRHSVTKMGANTQERKVSAELQNLVPQ